MKPRRGTDAEDVDLNQLAHRTIEEEKEPEPDAAAPDDESERDDDGPKEPS